MALLSDFGSTVSYITYIFSNSLLYPVMILLIILVIISLILAGEFITEYTRRNRNPEELDKVIGHTNKIMSSKSENKNNETAIAWRTLEKQTQYVSSFALSAAGYIEQGNIKSVVRLADSIENKMMKRVEKTRIITTIGPMLGLMGTLIPLGPALIGLTSGNIEALATNLVIAFATTVVGLFAAGIGFCLTTVRNRWYWQDSRDIDDLIDALEGEA
ncbi:MAG: MotA/TolQ/ExbB proton channel family protein [Methanimicrococcus sp.]|nr:MotA/TolQ/ExbB proton channel family protein [Methanimicrococcus sp.]